MTADISRRVPRLKIGVLGLVTIASYGCWHYAFSVLLDPIIDDTGWSEPFLTSAFGISILLGGIGAVGGGLLLDRFGSRFVFGLAAVLGLLGFGLAAATDSQALFAAGSSIGGGTIAALGFYHITQTVAVRVSPASSTRAIALLTVWGAFSSAVYMPGTALLLGRVGWRPTLLVTSLSAVITLVLAAGLIDTRTEQMPRSSGVFSELWGAMRAPAARWFMGSQALMGIVMGVVLAYQVPAMTAAGLPLAAASFWAGVRGFAQLLGRLPLLPIVDRLGVVNSMRLAYAAIGVGTVVLAFAGSPWIAALYAVVAGFGIGAVSPLIGMYSRDAFGSSSLGTAMGLVGLVFMVVGAVGPPIAGWIAVTTGSRSIPVIGAGALALISVTFLRAPRDIPEPS